MYQIAAQWPAKAMAQIFITGNTGIDALHYTVRNDFYHPETEWAKGSRLIAVTAHRRENLGEPMRDMFRAIRRIVEEFTDVKVIYPVHLNPQVRKIADEEFGGCERIHLIEPLDVVEFHNLMKASYLIMTDSGGIQEEAPALGLLAETRNCPITETEKKAVGRYLDWHTGILLETDGKMGIYRKESGKLIYKEKADSEDGYLGMYLFLMGKYLEKTESTDLPQYWKKGISLALKKIQSLMQDGYAWNVRNCMDYMKEKQDLYCVHDFAQNE